MGVEVVVVEGGDAGGEDEVGHAGAHAAGYVDDYGAVAGRGR